MQTQALDWNYNSTSLVISWLDRLLRSLVLDLCLIFQMWLWQNLRWAGMELEFFHICKMFIDSLCVRSLEIRMLNKEATIPNMRIPIWSHSKHLSALTLNLYKMFTTVHTRLPKKIPLSQRNSGWEDIVYVDLFFPTQFSSSAFRQHRFS